MSAADDLALDVLFRQAFRRHMLGVTVLPYWDRAGQPRGMTATSVCAVSAEPPQLLACINRRARSRDAIVHCRTFAVNMLTHEHRAISDACARPGSTRRRCRTSGRQTAGTGVPVVRGALVSLECTAVRAYREATHSICIGRIGAITLGAMADPLVYFDGSYRTLAQSSADVRPPRPTRRSCRT